MSIEDAALAARLGAIDVLGALPEPVLAELAAKTTCQRIAAGGAIISHLDRAASLMFLLEGRAKVTLKAANGRTLSVRPLEAGAHFGELAALTGAPRSLSVSAESDCLVCECPPAVFQHLMKKQSAFAHAIAVSLAHTVLALTERLFEMSVLEVPFRLCGELLRLAEHQPRQDGAVVLDPAPSTFTLADRIGARREVVNRELRKLEAEGLIERGARGRILIIRAPDALRERLHHQAGPAAAHTSRSKPGA